MSSRIISKKVILLYSLPQEKLTTLRQLLAGQGFSVQEVGQQQYGCLIEDLLKPGAGAGRGSGYRGVPLEPMLVMHGLTSQEIDQVLKLLKENSILIDLKAVTTPINRKWTSLQLYGQLQRERAQMLARRNN